MRLPEPQLARLLPGGCCSECSDLGSSWRYSVVVQSPKQNFLPLLLHVAGVQVAQTWCEDNLLVSVFKSKSTTNTAQKPNPCDRFLGHGNAFNASVRLPSFSGHHCGARNVLTAPDTALYPSCPLSPPRSVFPILCLAKAPPSRTCICIYFVDTFRAHHACLVSLTPFRVSLDITSCK
mgnify:CR=1 FL=1